jgi:A/G-specific adenine glycosylase
VNPDFARRVVLWQREHGRRDLPWQHTRDAYSIWVSEIMLQQTQVATVIPYYMRFMARFPDVQTLARASLDDVLAHWSGLGYYSRARNLHRAAAVLCQMHGGAFPRCVETAASLPGVGRSTAAAIVVFAYGGRHAILDGNVKRVLSRMFGIAGYPGDKRVAVSLWSAAERLLPEHDLEEYTQGLMDLGATVCVRRAPRCAVCPASGDCIALRDNRIAELPSPRPRKVLPHKNTVMLVLEHAGAVLLEKRPAPGIWGGLWCFPEAAPGDEVVALCARRFGADVDAPQVLPDVEHGFTHFGLTISPRRLSVRTLQPRVAEPEHQWLPIDAVCDAAIPAPVRTIVGMMMSE